MPFLDVRLIERVMSLRQSYPDHTLGQKAWLRTALKGVVPDEVLARPKAGFQPPIHEWLSGVVSRYGHVLLDGKLVSAGVLNREKIDGLCKEPHARGWTELFFIYKLVLLEYWYQEVVAQ
jgi:asparagine synthase (glutamine-hydrolysing)